MQKTSISRHLQLVAQNSSEEQRRNPAENRGFPASVAHVAHVAQENEQGCKGDGNDWRIFYEERAAIIEYDSGVSRSEAEAQAWECTVIQWMNKTPPKSIDDDHCASCGHHIGDVGRDAVPFLSGGGGHVWLHHGCHPTWMTRRRSDAEKALTAMGVTSP